MRFSRRLVATTLFVLAGLVGSARMSAAEEDPDALAESRALAYLGREVPRWSADNGCFSCHNNGDAARALYRASALGRSVPDAALANTTRWLEHPERWDRNGGDGPFSDKLLARIQFAAGLADAVESGRSKDRETLRRAADLIANDQGGDGSWQVDAQENVGSPATYGPALATVMGRRSLQAADPERFAPAVGRADRWLRAAPAANVLDAAAVLWGLGDSDDAEAKAQAGRCLDLIRRGEASMGGWGPFINAPAEPFDTAVVLIALPHRDDFPGRAEMIRRGRAFLIAAQRPDGSWPETTRPPDGESYAQRLSTTGWALQALMLTQEVVEVRGPAKPRKGD